MHAEWDHFETFYCAKCENETDRQVVWKEMKNTSLTDFSEDKVPEDLEVKGIKRKEDGLYYDKDGNEIYEVGTERFVDEQLRKYGPESDLPKAQKIFAASRLKHSKDGGTVNKAEDINKYILSLESYVG